MEAHAEWRIHAISRLVLNPHFRNIQASWTKLGHDGVRACLQAGVNDLGGTLMNETITRAAGASHGQETSPEETSSESGTDPLTESETSTSRLSKNKFVLLAQVQTDTRISR